MIDGAKQEIEEGRFIIYSEHGTGQLSLGLIVGFTATKVRVARRHYSWQNERITKTPERIIMVADGVAESIEPDFFNKVRNDIDIKEG